LPTIISPLEVARRERGLTQVELPGGAHGRLADAASAPDRRPASGAVLLIPAGRLEYGEPERRAIWPILEAIEEGMDTEGLRPEYRALLAELHGELGLYVGVKRIQIPTEGQRLGEEIDARMEDQKRRRHVMAGPGGVSHLQLDMATTRALLAAGVLTIAALKELAATDRLLYVQGIGARRADRIRQALVRFLETA
jgi:hypothetical protein